VAELKFFGADANAPRPPAAPTGLAASGGNAQVALSWSALPAVNGYDLKRASARGGPYTTIAGLTNATYVDTGLAAGTTNYYVVSAINAGGEGNNSTPASATTWTTFQVWQLANFGCTGCAPADPAADPDGDGMSNQAEWQAGTDPNNPSSSFRIRSILPAGNDINVTWQSGVGKTNVLQAGTLTNFTDITGPMAITVTPTNYVDHGGATNGSPRFYRIRLPSP
jgi:hypothetical protein